MNRPFNRTMGRAPAAIATAGALAALSAMMAQPAEAVVIGSRTSNVSFETLNQSMWGPDGPSVVDTGVLFLGPQWSNVTASGNAALQFGKTISLTSISKTVRDLAGLPSSVTIGSTSKTDVDLTGRTSGKIGLDFRAILDPGSVDASVDGQVELIIDEQGPDAAGYRSFAIQTNQLQANATLVTRSPQIDIESNFVLGMDAFLGIDGKVITQAKFNKVPSGCPFKVSVFTVPCVFSGQSEKSFTIDTEVQVLDIDEKEQLLKVTNTELTVAGLSLIEAEPDSGQIEILFDISADIGEFLSGTGNPIDVTVTDQPGQRKGKDVDPSDIFDLSVSVGDITLFVPLLNTEGTEQLNGITEVQTSGSTNLARLDVDADFLASIFFGLPPLGATLGVGDFSIGADLLDADVGALFQAGQDFSFAPELMQKIGFSEEVDFMVGDGPWQTGTQVITAVGASIEFKASPFQDVTVDAVYFLDNEFTNLTTLLGQPVFEADVLRVEFGAPSPIPVPGAVSAANFFEPLADPILLGNLFDESFALDGFEEDSGGTVGIKASLNGLAELITGSPVSISQEFSNPGGTFDLFFDTLFEDSLGTLQVFIDGAPLGSFTDDDAIPDLLFTTQQISGLSFLDALLTLEFIFDAPDVGTTLLLDNIFLSAGQIVNGDFQAGSLSGWQGGGDGTAQFAALSTIPEPGTLALLGLGLSGLGALAWRRRGRWAASPEG